MTFEEVALRFNVSRESLTALKTYGDLLTKWNAQINLVAPGTLGTMWERHFADSLQLLPLLPTNCKGVTDLGSGAGFPGLAMAIASGVRTTLIESNSKKAAFLNEVIRQTSAPAKVLNGRIEDMVRKVEAEVVTARALAPLNHLLDLAFPLLAKGARGLFLKGQDVEAELTEATKYWTMDYTMQPSVTDPKGVVLVIKEVKRAERATGR